MDKLTTWIQSFYAQAVTPPAQQMSAGSRLQGAAFSSNLDANHPLQSWAKRLSDSITGTAASDVAGTQATPTTSANDKWKTYVPIVLLIGAVWLIFTEA